ncbi:MAG: hypothetical protein ABFE07_29110 [Armatimonadia bacterium]
MSLLDRLAQDQKITPEELSKLSAVRQGLYTALEGGQLATVKFVQSTFAGASAQECAKLAEMVEKVAALQAERAVSEHGIESYLAANEALDCAFAKSANLKDLKLPPILQGKVGPVATAAVMGLLGMSLLHSAGQGIGMLIDPINNAVNKIQTKRESERILAEILEENPELKKDSKIVEHFAVLQKFAPLTAATNKPVAEAMLKKMNQWGQIDPQTMKSLVETEGSHLKNVGSKGKGEGFKPMSAGDLAALSGA